MRKGPGITPGPSFYRGRAWCCLGPWKSPGEGPIPSGSTHRTRYDSDMAKKKAKHGPQADRLKLSGEWQEALRDAVAKSRPSTGWPKPEKRYKPRKKKAQNA